MTAVLRISFAIAFAGVIAGLCIAGVLVDNAFASQSTGAGAFGSRAASRAADSRLTAPATSLSGHRKDSQPVHAGGGRVCLSAPCFRRAIRWHEANERHLRRELAVRYTRDATYAIRLASAAFGISETDMRTIAQCESNLGAQKYAEAGSGASGLFQFLPSTFARTPFAGFDIFDAEANAMAAAWLVRKDGNWREWSCSSITGVR